MSDLDGGSDAPIDSQIMSLIGSKTLNEYSKKRKQPAFRKSSHQCGCARDHGFISIE